MKKMCMFNGTIAGLLSKKDANSLCVCVCVCACVRACLHTCMQMCKTRMFAIQAFASKCA